MRDLGLFAAPTSVDRQRAREAPALLGIAELAELAVLLSTHDPDHAFGIANRVALLDQGRLADQGVPQMVFDIG